MALILSINVALDYKFSSLNLKDRNLKAR